MVHKGGTMLIYIATSPLAVFSKVFFDHSPILMKFGSVPIMVYKGGTMLIHGANIPWFSKPKFPLNKTRLKFNEIITVSVKLSNPRLRYQSSKK